MHMYVYTFMVINDNLKDKHQLSMWNDYSHISWITVMQVYMLLYFDLFVSV